MSKKNKDNNDEIINKNNDSHDVEGHANDEVLSVDHYHDRHHFDKYGNHDDVNEQDFSFKTSLTSTSKKNIIFRMTLTAVFLALAIISTAIDEVSEQLFSIPIPQSGGYISLRYLDITIVILSIASIGPLYASVIGFVIPLIHFALHPEHAIVNSVLECFTYALIVWYFWVLYYVVFKNSMIHKDINRKKDLQKRFLPIIPYVIVTAALSAAFVFLGLLLVSKTGETGSESGEEKPDFSWTDITNKKVAIIAYFVIFGAECLRFTITYSLFAVLEPTMKILNHKYR